MTSRQRALCLSATTVVLLAAIPVSSSLASGTTTLELGGAGLKSLRSQKVKLKAIAPATLKSSKLTLPVSGGSVSSTAVLVQQGSLRFTRGKRKVTITSVRMTVGPKPIVTARVDDKPLTLFTIKANPSAMSINQSVAAASLKQGRLTISATAAKAIRKKLRLRRAIGRGFGAITAEALFGASGSGSAPGSTVAPAGAEPPILARPAGAVDIVTATIDWHVRESFVDYLVGGGGSASPIAPATAGATIYDFRLPWRSGGWYHAPSGTADIFGGGGVRFLYSGHGIDISTSDPEVEINGSSSRVIFRLGDGKRAVLFNLNLTSIADSGSATTHTYTSIPGTVPAGASGIASFYAPGDPFGSVSVTFTTA